jgi:hypothetical protein
MRPEPHILDAWKHQSYILESDEMKSCITNIHHNTHQRHGPQNKILQVNIPYRVYFKKGVVSFLIISIYLACFFGVATFLTRMSMVEMKSPRGWCLLFVFLGIVLLFQVTASSSSSSSTAAFHHRGSSISPWCLIPRGGAENDNNDETTTTSLSSGNGASVDYVTQLESVKSQVLINSASALAELRYQIMNQGKVINDFASQADYICNQALEEFASTAPPATNVQDTANYDRCLQQIETALDTPLQVFYMKQLSYLRESALQRYRTIMKTGTGGGLSEYEAMLQVDADFVQQAETLRRSAVPSSLISVGGAGAGAGASNGGGWDYEGERSFLQVVMSNIAESGRKSIDIQIQAATAQQTTMQFLQAQQQMIQQLQMQLYGQSNPWNMGVAYRIPDTNFNIQGSYQQGRANIQLSCVPDEYAAFLGPNGFTNGVGPGNLGLSLNLSI